MLNCYCFGHNIEIWNTTPWLSEANYDELTMLFLYQQEAVQQQAVDLEGEHLTSTHTCTTARFSQ